MHPAGEGAAVPGTGAAHQRLALLCGLAAMLLAGRPLLDTAYTVPWDAVHSWLLALRWMGSGLHTGRFTESFPHVFSGFTIASQPEFGCYNLVYLLVAFLFTDSVLAINVLALVLQTLQLVLCFRLGRGLGLGPLGNLCFGLAVLASGFWVGHAEHFSFQSSAVGATALLAGVVDVAAGRRRAGILLFAGGCYMLGTAGYPALMLSVPLVLAAIAGHELRRVARPLRTAALLLCAAGLGLLAAAPALVHFATALARSHRVQGQDLSMVLRGSLPLYSLANFFCPGWCWPQWQSANDISMDRFHLLSSTPWVILILAAMLWRRAVRLPPALAARLPFWSGLAAVLLVLSLGKNFPLPLRAFLAQHFVLFRLGRWPGAEYIFFVELVLALAAAAGVEALAGRSRLRTALLAAAVVGDFLLVMAHTDGLRFQLTPPALAGTLPRFKVVYTGPAQALLDQPRLCPDTAHAMLDHSALAPSGFSWWGYMELVPDAYVREMESMRWALCSGPRLWDADSRQPIPYTLLAYTPTRLAIRFPAPAEGRRVLWAETVDPYWGLLVRGRPEPFETGPAALRYFRVPPAPVAGELQVDMMYRGPISWMWRRRTPLIAIPRD